MKPPPLTLLYHGGGMNFTSEGKSRTYTAKKKHIKQAI